MIVERDKYINNGIVVQNKNGYNFDTILLVKNITLMIYKM